MRQGLARILRLLNRRDKVWLGLILLSMLLAAVLEVVSIGSVPVLIALLADPERAAALPIVGPWVVQLDLTDSRAMLVWGGSAFLLLFMVRTALIVLSRYMQLHFAATRQVRIARQLYRQYLNAPYEFHLQRNSSELIRNLQTGAMRIGSMVISQFMTGLQSLLMLAAISMLLLMAQPGVTLLSLSIVGAFAALFIKFTTRKGKALGVLEMSERKEALKGLRQSFDGIKEVQLFGKAGFFEQQFAGRLKNITEALKSRQMVSFISGPMLEVLGVLALGVIAAVLLASGKSMVDISATLALFTVSIVRMRTYLSTLLGTHTNLTFNLETVLPVLDDIEAGTEQREHDRTGESFVFRKELCLCGVGYTYPDTSEPVLRGIELTIPRGAYIGLMGETGSGKSTLINLLLGLIPPSEGQVLVDGQDIAENLRSWQRLLAYVPQDTFLLDDTVRANVAYGVVEKKVGDEAVWSVLQQARLKAFIEELPNGLDTIIGERGVRFSGGQKQRLSIARALYRQPRVLVLDEATASLDLATEEELLNEVRALKGSLTIISVAHRQASLAACDIVYRLRDAVLVEGGQAEAEGLSFKEERHQVS